MKTRHLFTPSVPAIQALCFLEKVREARGVMIYTIFFQELSLHAKLRKIQLDNSTAVAGASYTWTAPSGSSISSGTNSQNAVGQGSGTYTLNVLSSAGCPYSATLSANVNTTTPTASATNGTLTCAQTSTVLIGEIGRAHV